MAKNSTDGNYRKGELNRGSAYAEATARQVTRMARHGESVRMADSDNWEESGGRAELKRLKGKNPNIEIRNKARINKGEN